MPADAEFCGECGAHLSQYTKSSEDSYTTPTSPVYPSAMDTSPLKTTDFLVLQLLTMIPLVGLVLMLIWSFSSDGNVNRRNFCRSHLIIYAIIFAIFLLMSILFISIIAVVLSNIYTTVGDFATFGMILH